MVRAGPSSLVDRLRMPMLVAQHVFPLGYIGGLSRAALDETSAKADMAEAAGRIDTLEAALKAVPG